MKAIKVNTGNTVIDTDTESKRFTKEMITLAVITIVWGFTLLAQNSIYNQLFEIIFLK